MFTTYPPYEFPIPPGLAHPDARYWRVVELSLHAPWFLLSVEVPDGEAGMSFVRTMIFGWESDLISFIPTVDAGEIKGLVCMVPGWKAPCGQWTSREVREVWLASAGDGHQFLQLIDADGQALDVGLPTEPDTAVSDRQLLLKFKPRRRRQTASRRPRNSARTGAKHAWTADL